jgi:hypothetical protein
MTCWQRSATGARGYAWEVVAGEVAEDYRPSWGAEADEGRRRMRGWWRRLLVVVGAVVVLLGALYGGLAVSTSRSQLARALVWRESDVDDLRRFPRKAGGGRTGPLRLHRGNWGRRRPAARAAPGQRARRRPDGRAGPGGVPGRQRHRRVPGRARRGAAVRGLLQRRRPRHGPDLDVDGQVGAVGPVGIAIGEGRIGSVDDPITRYVPELAGRDPRFGRITLRHLLTMTSGLRYEEGGPWGDDTATYYAPDLRELALTRTEVVEEPGRRFHYNNFNPLLIGLALERAIGTPVAAYLERKLWRPLGMEADGSWSLDSEASGFEKMESGLNGRPIDFAKFGLLFARDGAWRGRQLVPKAWVRDPTLVPTRVAEAPAGSYQYFWWVQDQRRPRAQFARGNYGQHVYVVPATDLVLVRFGRDFGYPHWPELLSDLAARL